MEHMACALWLVVLLVLKSVYGYESLQSMPKDPHLELRRKELLRSGYIYAGNVNARAHSFRRSRWNCSACQENLLSSDNSFPGPQSPIVSQTILADGSKYIRRESSVELTNEKLSRDYSRHNRRPPKWSRRLSQMWGPYDPEIQLNGADRKRVRSAHYPFSAVGQFDNGCTGTLVGPCHVLTAGHCIFDPSQLLWSKTLGFAPGRTGLGGWAPHGWAQVRSTNVMMRWELLSDYSADIGMVVLDWRIGERAGVMRFGSGDAEEMVSINMAGYPADKARGEMWYDYCSGSKQSGQGEDAIHHSCTPEKGNSGSPLWVYKRWNAFREIRGVHTGVLSDAAVQLTDSGNLTEYQQPFGVILTEKETAIIQKWIDEQECY